MIDFFIVLLFGFIASSFGSIVGGGALVTIPVLLAVGLPLPLAIGTNRFGAVFLELGSLPAYIKRREIDYKQAILPIAMMIPLSIIGANVTLAVNEKLLNITVGLLLICIALFVSKIQNYKQKIAAIGLGRSVLPAWAYYVLIPLLGFYGGFYGAGFGTFLLIILLTQKFSLIESIGQSRFIGLFMSSSAAIVFIANKSVDYKIGLILASSYIIGASIGSLLVHKIPQKAIYALVQIVAILGAIKLLVS